MYEILTRLFPKKIKEHYKNLLMYSDLKIDLHRFIGFVLFYGIFIGVGSSFYIGLFTKKIPLWATSIIIFFIFEILVYMWLILRSDKKGKFIEKVLPDALQLMSSNLRAGYTVDRALILSARPEFGPLADEINKIGKASAMGASLDEALVEMAVRIKSKKLEKTVSLIVTGLRSGGELASLLDQTSRNLREEEFVEQKIRTNVLTYVIFIFSAVGVGAPLLFGLSSFLIKILTENLANIEIPVTTVDIPIAITQASISTSFVIMFSIISLITTSTLGSLVLGLIAKGKEKEGFIYVFPLVIISLAIFFTVRFLIGSLLGGLFVTQ